MRMNVGCGPKAAPGWLNVDRRPGAGVDVVGDLTAGLPLRAASVEYAVAIHVLQDIPYLDVTPALAELRRVLGPEGVLRLALPDLDRALRAYLDNDRRYFYIGDEEVASTGGKFCVQVCWYGSVRTPFTFDFVEELARRAGFRAVKRCRYRETASRWPEIVSLDNRERESLFVEAAR